MRISLAFIISFVALTYGCTPLKSSPQEEKHQMELTVHEIQTNLDDLRHDFNCSQTELNILDGKIKHHETTLSSLKQKQVEKHQLKIQELGRKIASVEARLLEVEKSMQDDSSQVKKLVNHATEVSNALSQYKTRISELEQHLTAQNQKFEEISNIKHTIEHVARLLSNQKTYSELKTYKVKAGDTLEKIARKNDSNVLELKQINSLKNDLIVIGQELKVPVR